MKYELDLSSLGLWHWVALAAFAYVAAGLLTAHLLWRLDEWYSPEQDNCPPALVMMLIWPIFALVGLLISVGCLFYAAEMGARWLIRPRRKP